MNILQINSSARSFSNGTGSHSTRLAEELALGLQKIHAQSKLTVRDLTRDPHPQLDEAALRALHTPPAHRTPEQSARVAQDDALIAELMAADVIVLAAPMYNFGIPTQLKAWIDAIARVGVTFSYSEEGPKGLVQGKTVYIVTTRGGLHRDQASDTLVPYLRMTLGFLGMTDVQVIYAEGLAMGPDGEARALADARTQIAALLDHRQTA